LTSVKTREVLTYLEVAGSAGLQAGELRKCFDMTGAANPSATINLVLLRARAKWLVRRSDSTEKSIHYRGQPVYRWYITPRGRRWLARYDANELARKQRKLRAEEHVRARQNAREAFERRQKQLLATVVDPSKMTLQERNRKIVELRREGLPLRVVGEVFGITYERVRQIEKEAL